MLVEIFLDDTVLQHAAERQREAARRPGQPLGHDKVGGEHQRGAERERREAAAEMDERHAPAIDQEDARGGGDERQQHGERGAMGGGGDGDQHDQAATLGPAERVAAQQQEIERQHAEAAENVGEQDRGQPGQGGERRDSAAMTPSTSSGLRRARARAT